MYYSSIMSFMILGNTVNAYKRVNLYHLWTDCMLLSFLKTCYLNGAVTK